MTETQNSLARPLALTVGVAAALAVALGFQLMRGPELGSASLERALLDKNVIEKAAAELVRRSIGLWDSFPDPDVGRLPQANKRGYTRKGIAYDTNRFGMREREYDIPKPAGTLRIVLLGDSYVFGGGVAAADRAGVFLEREMNARLDHEKGSFDGRVEVLHIGVLDWNIVAETNFLRRQLSLLDPDLVVHVLIHNDLDDQGGTRGFGEIAAFNSQVRERADAMVSTRQAYLMGAGRRTGNHSLLNAGLDWESRTRYAHAAAEIARLRRMLDARGCEYAALLFWNQYPEVAAHYLLAELSDSRKTFVPTTVPYSPEWRVSSSDNHWSVAAHERVACQIYWMIRRANLLPGLRLEEWPEGEEVALQWDLPGRSEAQRPIDARSVLGDRVVHSAIDLAAMPPAAGAQFHGGISKEGAAKRYVSVVLRNTQAKRLSVRLAAFDRPELDGQTRVFVDELEVGQWDLPIVTDCELSFDLPEELAQRAFVTVRFESSDSVYSRENIRRSIAFRLVGLALK